MYQTTPRSPSVPLPVSKRASLEVNILGKLFSLLEHRPYVSKARVSSCLVYKKDIVSIGFNRMKTHPFQKEYSKNEEAIYLHAEIDAIIQARKELTLDEMSKSTLYIIRRKQKDGFPTWGLSKPCKGCLKCITDNRIQRVVYSCEGTGNYEEVV